MKNRPLERRKKDGRSKKMGREIGFVLVFLFLVFGLSACGQKQDAPPKKMSQETKPQESDEPSATGASFQEGQGLALLAETQKSLGLEFAEVGERIVQPTIHLTAQIYRSATEASRLYGKERRERAYATVLVSPEAAAQLKPGQKLAFASSEGATVDQEGMVWKIESAQIPVLGQAEILLELTDADHRLAVGNFVAVQVPLGSTPRALVGVPPSAVLETSTGTYAFVKNGNYWLRTSIKTGLKNKDYIEITEGLYEGDMVAVKPVEALYLIELRETKGGGHCH
jgi:hypothetical protein